MPELPEVETTRRGIQPALVGKTVTNVIVREARLRWPVPENLGNKLIGQTIADVTRRGKYLLLQTAAGHVIIHLGMSGSLRTIDASSAPRPHDHVDIILDNGTCLRLHDPRRFGAVLWTDDDPLQHKVLVALGPEPVADDNNGTMVDGDYQVGKSRGRRRAGREVIMESHNLGGSGNIYASEALFLAGIHPQRAAGRISQKRCQQLTTAIKKVLAAAIRQGGTTLRDFTHSDGSPGYFKQRLKVYGRAGQACPNCERPIRQQTIGQIGRAHV